MKAILLAAILASILWEGVAFHGHTFQRWVPLGDTGIVVAHRIYVPICIHINWRARRMSTPAPGTMVA